MELTGSILLVEPFTTLGTDLPKSLDDRVQWYTNEYSQWEPATHSSWQLTPPPATCPGPAENLWSLC